MNPAIRRIKKDSMAKALLFFIKIENKILSFRLIFCRFPFYPPVKGQKNLKAGVIDNNLILENYSSPFFLLN